MSQPPVAPPSAEAAQPDDAARIAESSERALAGNLAKGEAKLKAQNKLFVRDRLALLLDAGSFQPPAPDRKRLHPNQTARFT